MGNVVELIIRPIEAVFGKFDTDDSELVLDAYITALSEFADDTLRAAYSEVVRDFKPSRRVPVPVPAFFVAAARKHLAASGKTIDDDTREQWRKPLADDLKAAEAYMIENSSSLINMALREGWGRSLRDVARDVIRQFREKHRRRPSQRELLAFRMPQADVDYYRKGGQTFAAVELDRIISERARLGNWQSEPQQQASREP